MNSKQKALQLVSKGIKASETDIDTATALFLQAWAHDKSDYDVLTAVAASLADLGQYETAMTVLQEALQSQGESDIICSLIGKIAINMQMYDIAEKTLSRSIELNPNNTDGIADLITALSAQNKFAEAEAFIQAALDVFHDSANLYNALGNISLAKSGDRFAAIEAYKKATELDPKDSKYIHNLAIAYYLDEEAQSCYEQAITLAPADPQIHLSYAIYLFQKGKIGEGWKHYEHRNHPDLGYNKSAKYTHDLPNWDGGDPTGKKLLITSEQGIGDEVFFAAALPKLYECAEQLFIGCEPRLQSIIKRSFPKAIVDSHSDQRNYSVRFRSYPEIERNLKDNTYSIDAACLAATALSYQCQSADDYKALRGGYLKPDPTLVEKYSVVIRKDGKKKNIAV
ncbi:MAG: tetratricopeptide repeat protein, partial [Kordiimonas sp.]